LRGDDDNLRDAVLRFRNIELLFVRVVKVRDVLSLMLIFANDFVIH